MVSKKLLELTGCTPVRLRDIFTCANAESANGKIRKRIEERVKSRVLDGMQVSLGASKIHQAVDMAWDSTPIQSQVIPLLLFAQGKIQLETLAAISEKDKTLSKYCSKDAEGRLKIDLPRLYEVSINLIRSYVTRRLAAQSSRFSNLWPYFKYEPFGTDEVAKLRGEALSQRIDVMVNAYNYRHLFPQSFRHMFLYGRAVMFPRCAWDTQIGWRPKAENVEGEETKIESFVEKEGVDLVLAHPSRYYWDRSAPLPNINTDNGPSYIGYWDVVTYGVLKAGEYYNIDRVSTSSDIAGIVSAYSYYFSQYFDPKVMKMPDCNVDGNDRRVQIGLYTANDCDKGVVVTQHFEKINPHTEGIGTLNTNVWLRLSVAGDGTIIGAEFMPSIPAIYGGFNENDDRLVNASMATELMAFQDQLSNIFSQMLATMRTSMSQIWAIDKDLLDKDAQEYMKDVVKKGQYYGDPHVLFYSGSQTREAGFQSPDVNPRSLLTIIQANASQTVHDSLKAIEAVLNAADRLMVLSPNEIGQPNPREVSAREVTEIATTTNSISSFISDGIDEQRQAFKKLLYESLIGFSEQTFRIAAISRYTRATIAAAGFNIENDKAGADGNDRIKSAIIGKPDKLIYDYYFNSRDGAERPSNAQAAGALSQLMGQVLQVEPLVQAIGRRRIFDIFNEIFRLSGVPYNLVIEDGEEEGVPRIEPTGPAPQDTQTAERLARIEQFLNDLVRSGVAPTAAPAAHGSGAPPGSLMAG